MLSQFPQSPETGVKLGSNSKSRPLGGGRLACAWRETDAESTDRVTLIRDLLHVQ